MATKQKRIELLIFFCRSYGDDFIFSKVNEAIEYIVKLDSSEAIKKQMDKLVFCE